LKVPKLRYYHDYSISNSAFADPICIGKYNATKVSVILAMNSEYHGSAIVGKEFVASIHQIECLDREKFDVFILHEGIDDITYEIINKTL